MATSNLDKLISKLQETYKGAVMDLRKGGEVPGVERIPLESPKIESLFGIGGVPRGRIVEVFGPESSGKTSLCEYIAGQFQKADLEYTDPKTGEIKTRKGIVAYIDAEHAMSLEYAKVHGFCPEGCILVQPDSGEQACDIAIQLAESGEVDLIVIDSIAAMTPEAEIEADMSNMTIGLQARMLSKFFRKATGILDKTNTTLLCINQVRMNIGGYGNPETTCVTPDTYVQFTDIDPKIVSSECPAGLKTIEDMFAQQGVDWTKMPKNCSVSTRGDLFITSCYERFKKTELKRVLKLVRKQDSPVFRVFLEMGGKTFYAFSGTPDHQVYARFLGMEYQWVPLKRVYGEYKSGRDVYVQYCDRWEGSTSQEVKVKGLRYIPTPQPILDMEVEFTHAYYANGVLSHNTGGKALKFYSSVRIETRRREYITEKNETKGIIINAKTVKNKTAPPMVRQQLDMYFDRSFDASMEWVDFAVEYQVIAQAGAGFFTLPNGERIRGRQNVIDFLKKPENSEVYEDIKRQTKERMYSKQSRRVSVDDPEDEKEILKEIGEEE